MLTFANISGEIRFCFNISPNGNLRYDIMPFVNLHQGTVSFVRKNVFWGLVCVYNEFTFHKDRTLKSRDVS